VGLNSLKSLNLTNGYPNKNKKNKNKNKNNNNNKVKSKPLELRSRVKIYIKKFQAEWLGAHVNFGGMGQSVQNSNVYPVQNFKVRNCGNIPI
jgi:hypothetical protein